METHKYCREPLYKAVDYNKIIQKGGRLEYLCNIKEIDCETESIKRNQLLFFKRLFTSKFFWAILIVMILSFLSMGCERKSDGFVEHGIGRNYVYFDCLNDTTEVEVDNDD